MFLQFDFLKYFIIPLGFFILAMIGVFLIRQNIIIILMCLELILLAININFVLFSVYLDNIFGQVVAVFILSIAGAESAVGLAILIIYYRIKGVIAINYINSLKG